MLPSEEQPMHANQFCSVPEGIGQLHGTCNVLLSWEEKMCIFGRELGYLPRGITQFLGGAADYCLELHNFLAEHPFWEELRNFLSE